MDTTAVEINPQVLVACRGWFKLPADGPRLRVLLADAAEEVRNPEHTGRMDSLQVDLYDHEAAAPVLDSPDFYADCRSVLTDDGIMTVNLFGRDTSYERSLQSIAAAFGEDAVWAFKPTREGNTIVLAQRTPDRPTRMQLLARAEAIQTRWGLPAVKWLKLFKPVA
jgi:spermidine synthase